MIPLAERLRPQSLEEIVGQDHLLGANGVLRLSLASGQLPSIILWGPPGVGKTTLARLLAQSVNASMLSISAVLSGVKEIREAVERAQLNRSMGRSTVVFVDEVHRFNKSQQDAFLPHVESGLFAFVGATTENPAFEVNGALLSRAQVLQLHSLSAEALVQILHRAEQAMGIGFEPAAAQRLIDACDGDGRRLLNLLGLFEGEASSMPTDPITEKTVLARLPESLRRFDQSGDVFYDQISALHKSVRGSDPDAALYWLARMLDGGADARYLARRLIRMASEEVGLADPRVLGLAIDAAQAYERLGSPEGELALAQAAVYIAAAPKSNAVYKAWNSARTFVKGRGSDAVPDHLRNAPTALAKSLGHGKAYRYSHDEPHGFSAGQRYFPDNIQNPPRFYEPLDRGLESKIAQRFQELRRLSP
ncbi:MAG: replication-associated recombination protein A [Betaproteobacteria bacterium]|nr:replication-associated recombination protein A [Betaproteobacteria bacterium]